MDLPKWEKGFNFNGLWQGRAGLAIFPCTSQESQQTTVKAALFLNIARVFTAPTVGDFP